MRSVEMTIEMTVEMTVRERFLTFVRNDRGFVQNDRECHFDRREKSHTLGRDDNVAIQERGN